MLSRRIGAGLAGLALLATPRSTLKAGDWLSLGFAVTAPVSETE